jgi:hypothetical protein
MKRIKNIIFKIILCILGATIIVILAFPRATWQKPGRNNLYIKFFSDKISIKMSNASPIPHAWYAVHIYPIWAIGGLKSKCENYQDFSSSYNSYTFCAHPLWILAYFEFLFFFVILSLIILNTRRKQ